IEPTRSKLSARNKRVLITGGGSAIGRAIAKAIATPRARDIAIINRTQAALAKTKISIDYESSGDVIITAIVAGITDQQTIEKAFAAFGSIDILINNAGLYPISTLSSTSHLTSSGAVLRSTSMAVS
ncbi:MAG: hypothetical protein Q9169_004722, partial [Polycauliona sp. 2 TL-2023]